LIVQCALSVWRKGRPPMRDGATAPLALAEQSGGLAMSQSTHLPKGTASQGMRRTSKRWVSLLAITALVAGLNVAAATSVSSAAPVTHAVSTTTNVNATTGNGACLNGGPNAATEDPVNCNSYDSKADVWLSGLPNSAALGAGTYFFAVLDPGGQADPNDGATKNLSNSDTHSDRSFSIDSSGAITNLGTHQLQNNELQMLPYDNTTNPGGVYILAVCKIDATNTYPVAANDCKYDAFKVRTAYPSASGLVISKDAAGAYDNTYTWGIAKSVDKTLVKQAGGSATFNYTVAVTHDAGSISHVTVTGTIAVFNPNNDPVSGVTVADQLSDRTNCTVNGTFPDTVQPGETDYTYSCSLYALPQGQLDNVAAVSWPAQDLSTDGALPEGSADFTFSDIAFTANLIDNCVSVSDSFAGLLGSACVGEANPKSFTYARTIAMPQYGCVSYPNTATFTTNTTGTTGSASQTVTVCGPVHTGALTIGFWQNKNGQGIIKAGASTYGVCNSGTWLRHYAPFQGLSATASCATVATYVYNVIKAATCGGSTCNAMLKAQMLATALNVYFSDPTLGGNKINAPHPIGGVTIDLTKICAMIDGSGGVSTCGSTYESVSAAFGGATSLTVSQMLAYAASQSNAGGTVWYGQVKATQTLAKDAFDAINNQVAFAP
jgi:hypothetical protein